MLIRITDRCTMGCAHCFIEKSGPKGNHMTRRVFDQALDFGARLGVSVAVLSGGEPTEHPDLVTMVRHARAVFPLVTIVSNGLFMRDEAKYQTMVQLTQERGGRLFVQITNDKRFYPQDLSDLRSKAEGHGWSWEDCLRQIVSCSRTQTAGIPNTRRSPSCFNLRANSRITGLRPTLQALEFFYQLVCTPSINIDGSICAGEMDTCQRIGTVFDRTQTVEILLQTVTCRSCSLLTGLTPKERSMMGEEA